MTGALLSCGRDGSQSLYVDDACAPLRCWHDPGMARLVVILIPLFIVIAAISLALDVFGVRTWLADWIAYTFIEQVRLTQ